jgi:hypothetical protein
MESVAVLQNRLGLRWSSQREVERLGGFHEVESLSRPSVELGGDGVEVALGEGAEVAALGEYWRNRPLVFSFEPRGQGLRGSQK